MKSKPILTSVLRLLFQFWTISCASLTRHSFDFCLILKYFRIIRLKRRVKKSSNTILLELFYSRNKLQNVNKWGICKRWNQIGTNFPYPKKIGVGEMTSICTILKMKKRRRNNIQLDQCTCTLCESDIGQQIDTEEAENCFLFNLKGWCNMFVFISKSHKIKSNQINRKPITYHLLLNSKKSNFLQQFSSLFLSNFIGVKNFENLIN